jgi:acyl carrier protein
MQNFINDLLELFDEKPPCEINGETIFKDIPGWDSLVALSLIVMISDNYGKSIDGEVIRKCHTIRELYDDLND